MEPDIWQSKVSTCSFEMAVDIGRPKRLTAFGCKNQAAFHYFQVIANGILAEKTDLPDNRRLTHWKTTVPIPTKVMVIGVAHFAVQNVGYCEGVPIESWVYTIDRDKGFENYAPAVQITQFFNDLIGRGPVILHDKSNPDAQ